MNLYLFQVAMIHWKIKFHHNNYDFNIIESITYNI